MSRPKITPQQLQDIRDFAAQWGKIVARRAFGESGPGLDVDFQAMEAVVAAATAGLTEGTFTTLLEQQTQALAPEHPCPDCQQLCPVKRQDRPLEVPGGRFTYREPSAIVPSADGTFSPLRTALRLDNHGYSPTTLFKIAEASAKLHSHDAAAYAVGLTGLQISPRHVCSIATAIGLELVAGRDHKVALHHQHKLPTRVATPPEVVAIGVDGGRLGTRAPGCGPGVHEAKPKEEKIACLVSLTSDTYEEDPQPQPPPSLMQPRRVQRLVRQIHGSPGDMFQEEEGQEDTDQTVAQTAAEEAHARTSPVKRVRTCVASLRDVHAFGPMVAAEAQERGFHQALRQAFVGDGQASNWTIHKTHFKDYWAIADFIHVICYLYVTAWGVGGSPEEQWSRYLGWLRSCWQGRVGEVIEEMAVWQQELGEPPEGEELAANDPRRLLAEALSYLRNNQSRMDYPRYRQEGLPVTSSLVESLVGEFNARLKSKQKYWDRLEGTGCEAMLQLRAAVLSEDDRLARHFAQRPGNPYRRRYPNKKVANVS